MVMGRTKRTRIEKKLADAPTSKINWSDEVIALMKWMGNHKWRNTSGLKFRDFEETGRGVTSPKSVKSGDTLFRIPYRLLITYSTAVKCKGFMNTFKLHCKFEIQDLLAAFLVIEKHKGTKSPWNYYIKSLPYSEPKLPWLSQLEEIECFPEDLRKICKQCRNNFEESWARVKGSLEKNVTCLCCNKPIEDILNLKSYTWAYIMVNTRGVYINPDPVRNLTKCDILLDEPCVALVPLMDMFNHSDSAETEFEFHQTQDDSFYQLKTLTNYEKYNQIFISYGRHDNIKLFAEYGFYLPRNANDKLKFSPEEIFQILDLKLNKSQYNFLRNHQFLETDELFISSLGLSFKLKGFLYAALYDNEHYSFAVFSGYVDKFFGSDLKVCVKKLFAYKLRKYRKDCEFCRNKICSNTEVLNFLQNRIEFIECIAESRNTICFS